MIQFTIPGVPTPKGRQRHTYALAKHLELEVIRLVRSGRPPSEIRACIKAGVIQRAYTPEETIVAEQALQLQVLRQKPHQPFAGPLRFDVVFGLQRPQHLGSDRSSKWPHIRPDIDNFLKTPADAWNGIFWEDDSQICAVSAMKIYGAPRTEVRISQLSDADEAQHTLWGGIDAV